MTDSPDQGQQTPLLHSDRKQDAHARSLRPSLLRIVLTTLIIIIVWTQWFQPMRVDGDSMEPTISDGSFNIISLRRYHNRAPKRGEVVAARKYLGDNRYLIIKRVIGLPGESIGFRDGMRFINNQPEPELYLTDRGSWNVPPILLGPDEFFIVGDNRTIPWPEHTAGAIHQRHIIGGIVFP